MKLPVPKFVYVVAFLALVGFVAVTLRGPRGIPALIEKEHQIQELEKRNAALAQEVERKRDRIRRLVDSPAQQELEIRQRLKLVGPRDKVFILGDTARK
jgi:cell division protein FtsB